MPHFWRFFASASLGVLACGQVSAMMTELSADYGFDRTKYGQNRQNRIEAEHIRTSVAFYMFNYTALEINYSQSATVSTEKKVLSVDSVYNVTGSKNQIFVHTHGIGLRQALASRRARVRPSFSLGYARRSESDKTDLDLVNNTSGTTFKVSGPTSKKRYDSVFGTLALNLRLTRGLSLRGSLNTIFEAFKFDEAQDNIKYMVGLAWVF